MQDRKDVADNNKNVSPDKDIKHKTNPGEKSRSDVPQEREPSKTGNEAGNRR